MGETREKVKGFCRKGFALVLLHILGSNFRWDFKCLGFELQSDCCYFLLIADYFEKPGISREEWNLKKVCFGFTFCTCLLYFRVIRGFGFGKWRAFLWI